MNAEQWRQLAEMIDGALAQPTEQREEWLRNACGDDQFLYREVHTLLAHENDGFTGLRQSVAEAGAGFVASSAIEPGTRFGPWRVVRLIGQGGMGDVYEAVREDGFEKRVAIKLIRFGFDTEFGRSRFQRERRILARLDHPNIARLLDGGETETGRPWLAVEYVEGKPLLEAAAKLSVAEKLDLFRKVLSAVAYAHRNLIVHRDIKPSNILVTADGDPRLLDFGISRLLDDSESVAQATSVMMMTPDYASPEQVRGEPAGIPSDIYSAGAVLYELLTGHRTRVLSSYSVAALFHAVCETDIPPPSERVEGSKKRDLTPDLDTICLKALAIDPARRYLSAESFSEDIRRYREGLPIAARPDTFFYRSSKFIRRNKWQVAAVIAIILTLSGGIVATTRQARISDSRFQEGRRLAKTVLFDIYREIETLPGSVKVRGDLVNAGMQYLDRLYPQAGNDPALRFELANAYERIGNAQYFGFSGHLGRRAEAVRNWSRALEITRELRRTRETPEVLGVFGRSNIRLAISQIESGRLGNAVPYLNSALEAADKMAPLMPGSSHPGGIISSAEVLLGVIALYSGDPIAAERHHRRAQETISAHPSAEEVDRVRDKLNIGSRIALDLTAEGRLSEADALISGGLAQAEALLSHTKLDSSLSHYVAASHLFRGRMIAPRPCNSLNDRRTSQRELDRAIDIYRDMLRRDPEDDDAQEMYADALTAAATVSRNRATAAEALAIIVPKTDRDPENADLAFVKARAMAVTAGPAAPAQYEQLATRFPERLDFRVEWIDALRASGEGARARALALELKNRYPANADFACRGQ